MINIGEIWKANKKTDIHKTSEGDYFIILSLDCEYYRIGQFWFSNQGGWGGARQMDLTCDEIERNGKCVGSLRELLE